MKLYRFSPIKSEDELMEVIKYLHVSCSKLCFKILGKYLPVAGNIGIFSHYDQEFEELKRIQEKITLKPDEYNNKYLVLKNPIEINLDIGINEGIYEYLYVRNADPYRHHVGDVDFYLNEKEYFELKKNVELNRIKGARYLDRLDMIELFDPDFDVLVYISSLRWFDRIEANK